MQKTVIFVAEAQQFRFRRGYFTVQPNVNLGFSVMSSALPPSDILNRSGLAPDGDCSE